MLNKNEIKNKIKANSDSIQKYGINRIGLFGSYVRNSNSQDSDIDILVDFDKDKETFDNFMNLCNLLEDIFKTHKIDVVTTQGLSPYIGPHILKTVEYVEIAH